MFFKKKGYQDVEGYNRISRLIEDRQRELSADPVDDDFDEEAVLLRHEPAVREAATPRVQEQPTAPVARAQTPPPEERPAQTRTASVPQPEERRIPFQPQPADMPPATLESPAMTLPDLGGPAVQGSLVAAEAVWEGKLITNGNVRVEGTVRGEVQTAGMLFVAANARIDGTIQARSILLAGEIEGQIHCGERLEVLPGGSARGEVETATLVVHEGAFIDSRFQMRQQEATSRR